MSRWKKDILSCSRILVRLLVLIALSASIFPAGCAKSGVHSPTKAPSSKTEEQIDRVAAMPLRKQFGTLPVQSATGEKTLGNESVTIDISNVQNGYYYVTYLGSNPKVKLQVTGPDRIKYTYNLTNRPTCLPVSGGNGAYELSLFENISGDQYATAFKGSFEAALENEFLPFLYPNMYVNFSERSQAVILASSLAEDATCDLEVVSRIYHYVTANITYDTEEAETVAYNYLPDIDEVLETKKGICFDYAALLAGMLRSQSIPTRLQIGYAGSAYHAWISTYIEDIGWIDGMIRFDGQSWSLMDPTFAANQSSSESLKKFIGDGSNYQTLYTY